MNRTHDLPVPPRAAAGESEFSIDSALFSPSSKEAPCALFAPLHYEPNYRYPLIVWLHGNGDDERQLVRIMPTLSLRNYVAVAPRGFPLAGDAPDSCGWAQTEPQIREAEQRVLDGIEHARGKMSVAPDRVFLAGHDSGGTMAVRVAMSHPHRFAGVLTLGGPLPTGHAPLGRLVEARRLPIFLAVGRDSATYPSSLVCDNLRLLHAAGMSITLRQYPCGHELTPQMLRDVDRWVIEQVTQQPLSSREPGNVH